MNTINTGPGKKFEAITFKKKLPDITHTPQILKNFDYEEDIKLICQGRTQKGVNRLLRKIQSILDNTEVPTFYTEYFPFFKKLPIETIDKTLELVNKKIYKFSNGVPTEKIDKFDKLKSLLTCRYYGQDTRNIFQNVIIKYKLNKFISKRTAN